MGGLWGPAATQGGGTDRRRHNDTNVQAVWRSTQADRRNVTDRARLRSRAQTQGNTIHSPHREERLQARDKSLSLVPKPQNTGGHTVQTVPAASPPSLPSLHLPPLSLSSLPIPPSFQQLHALLLQDLQIHTAGSSANLRIWDGGHWTLISLYIG